MQRTLLVIIGQHSHKLVLNAWPRRVDAVRAHRSFSLTSALNTGWLTDI